jgi:hypothetical protein
MLSVSLFRAPANSRPADGGRRRRNSPAGVRILYGRLQSVRQSDPMAEDPTARDNTDEHDGQPYGAVCVSRSFPCHFHPAGTTILVPAGHHR